MARSKRILAALLALAIGACASVQPANDVERVDILITGGEVYDGSGELIAGSDIAIRGGEISRIEPGLVAKVLAAVTIDATGLVVAPGFIDPHTHADGDLTAQDPALRANLAFAFQGVTTVMVGNDGFGFAKARSGEQLQPTGTNFAFLSGFGDLRRSVIGMEDRPASPAERERMIDLLRKDFCAGAFGFSAGLYYAPQGFAETDEVVGLAKEAAAMGGYYDTHLRDESDFSVGVLAALEEAIEIGRQASIPVHIAHIKALGPSVWGQSAKMITSVKRARAEGLQVTADQYPWRASGTRISNALVPRWALDGGLDALRKRIEDSKTADAVAEGIAANIKRRGGPESLLVTAALGTDPAIEGQTLGALASARSITPEMLALAILKTGDARLASFNMDEADIVALGSQDWVMTGSDGSSGHPRKYASFPKAYADWVRTERKDLGWFIRRSTGIPASVIGLTDRGYLRPGYVADIVIFDPETFAPLASYSEPERLSTGVRWLVVNGEMMIADGRNSGSLPGKLIKQSQPPELCNANSEDNAR